MVTSVRVAAFFFFRNMIETVSTVLKDGDGKATETNHLVLVNYADVQLEK